METASQEQLFQRTAFARGCRFATGVPSGFIVLRDSLSLSPNSFSMSKRVEDQLDRDLPQPAPVRERVDDAREPAVKRPKEGMDLYSVVS